jgi:hypothetical protein
VTGGLAILDKEQSLGVSKEVALAAVSELLSGSHTGKGSVAESLAGDLAALIADPVLLTSLRRLQLLELGEALLDANECPLCETAWDEARLRAQLAARLASSLTARELHDRIVADGRRVADQANRYVKKLEQLSLLPEASGELEALLGAWARELEAFAAEIVSFDGIQREATRCGSDWLQVRPERKDALTRLGGLVTGRPELENAGKARDFLVVAERLLDVYQKAQYAFDRAGGAADCARTAYSLFVETADYELAMLYGNVEADFCKYYQTLNSDDESNFTAELTPDDAGLGFSVDFFNRGLFPPGALHSEGHQDGMGVCLYLALVKRALAKDLSLVVLDDVVMSVDVGHRRRFCDLLKQEFPQVQFVITTHDEVWARQVRSAGLVASSGVVMFHSWDIENGPLVEVGPDVWDRITLDLKKNDVSSAAAKLRRHLECALGDVADGIGAHVQYRADGAYDLGDKLNGVLARQRDLLKKAEKAAKSWDQDATVARVGALRTAYDAAVAGKNGEQWIINKAVHYNEWASLVRLDFEPVVTAFQQFLKAWQCPKCETNLALTSRIDPKGLQCRCGETDFNLVTK